MVIFMYYSNTLFNIPSSLYMYLYYFNIFLICLSVAFGYISCIS